jgi:hypothetical protein
LGELAPNGGEGVEVERYAGNVAETSREPITATKDG